MPIYDWECGKCGGVSLIFRRMADFQVPPATCDHCHTTSEDLSKVITRPDNVKGFILKEGGAGGFHDFEYTKYRSIK
jgi:putative FmdB family regulatory protein